MPDDLESYEQLRREHGVEAALVVGFEGEPRYVGNNDHILDLAARHAWIVPLVYLHPVDHPTVGSLEAFVDRDAAGYAIYASTTDDANAILNWPVAAAEEIVRQGALISINAGPEALSILAPWIARLDPCPVLISHLGLPGRHDTAPERSVARDRLAPLVALAELEHVSVKLSGLYAISIAFPAAAAPFVELTLETFGSRRVLWGSDFPPLLDHSSFAAALEATALTRCDEQSLQLIMRDNLLRLIDDHAGRN